MKVPALLFAVKYSFLSMLRFWRNRMLVLQCEAQVDHQAVHQYPEDGERHGLAHDITILTLHVAGGGSDGDTLWRQQFTSLRACAVGSGKPVGLVTAYSEER